MAVVHEVPREESWWVRALTTDFCPWANRFVYWLKEPIGWFVLATCVCCVIGLYFSPVGWSLAAALMALISIGMIWPLIAVHVVRLQVTPESAVVHEDSRCDLIVSVQNRIPIPIWGLSIEGYLDQLPSNDPRDGVDRPSIALASAPPLCHAEYRIAVRPTLRGRYPVNQPEIACSFPFAIWTARRRVRDMSPLTVWPRVFPIAGTAAFQSRVRADVGVGQRRGGNGDFIGVRDYRRGDSAKQVHWVASARTGSLVVTDRGAPETAEVAIWIDTECYGDTDELSQRMRAAASIVVSLHDQRVPMEIHINDRCFRIGERANGLHPMLDCLANVPLDGLTCRRKRFAGAWIEIAGSGAVTEAAPRPVLPSGVATTVRLCNPSGAVRGGHAVGDWHVDSVADLGEALLPFWREVGHADIAA